MSDVEKDISEKNSERRQKIMEFESQLGQAK